MKRDSEVDSEWNKEWLELRERNFLPCRYKWSIECKSVLRYIVLLLGKLKKSIKLLNAKSNVTPWYKYWITVHETAVLLNYIISDKFDEIEYIIRKYSVTRFSTIFLRCLRVEDFFFI